MLKYNIKITVTCSLDIIKKMKSRRMRWVRNYIFMGEMRNAYKILVGRPKGRSLRRQRHRW
jgi:hypothetical protein